MKLYEISGELSNLLSCRDAEAAINEGVYSDDWDTKIDAIQMDMSDKAISCAHYYINESAMADALKQQADKLLDRARTHAKNADWIKGYMARCVPQGKKIENDTCVIGWRKSASVEILNPALLDDKYIDVRTERVPIKAAIKEAIKAGEVVCGAALVEKNNITIK